MKHRAVVKILLLAGLLLVAGLVPLPRRSVDVRVASKKFTESVTLGTMLKLLAESQEIEAVHYRELGGTTVVFDALVAGQIDAYPEYVGTITQEILHGQEIPDEAALRDLLAQKGIGISDSLGFNNTYALALTRERAEQLRVTRISDLKRFPELRIALTHELLDRGDGWHALVAHYQLPQRDVVGVDHDIAYRQLEGGEIDLTDVYSTDAIIRRNELVVLEDDLNFFPRYDAVWLYRLDLAQRHPSLVEEMRRVAGQISTTTMQTLNDDVEAGRLSELEAAAEFLRRELQVQVHPTAPSGRQMVLRHVVEHLDLVRRSLIPAIVVGVALGVFCQRWKRSGQIVLALVGLLQTIPSLALLVMLLPIVAALGYRSVGEGSVTAIIALFGYCLLPIVRNTYTGLHSIQRSTIESATVLGLGTWARLTQIELPIALPTILAGIRTAAVQNVGFATLGAIIGAGGLGQLILRGIRLNDTSLILAGAIPAAALALLLQYLVDLIDRFVVPQGLKRTPSHE